MKLRIVLVAVVVAAFAASAAVAAPPPGKGKPTTGAGCKPSVAVILTGTLAADGTALPSALSVKVTGGNRAAQVWVKATQPTSISITSSTKVSRQGDHALADLKSGDRVNIQARACKADLANGSLFGLTATRVTAHPTS
jgi:hypothetical protein